MPAAALEPAEVVTLPGMRLDDAEGAAFTWLHVLYRLRDAAGELIYVGITNDIRARFYAHAREKWWWNQVASCEIEFWPTRLSLENEEVRVIQTEKPRYNRRPGWVIQASGAVTPVRRGTKVEFVIDEMIRLIIDKKFREGDRLPSQAVLCEKFAVSLITLRAALLKLSNFGLIETKRGDGSRVAVALCPSTEVEVLTDVICGKWEEA